MFRNQGGFMPLGAHLLHVLLLSVSLALLAGVLDSRVESRWIFWLIMAASFIPAFLFTGMIAQFVMGLFDGSGYSGKNITKEAADILALEFIASQNLVQDHELAILEEETTEKSYGWVFSVCTKQYKETRDSRYALFGLGPLIVYRNNGEVRLLGSGEKLPKE